MKPEYQISLKHGESCCSGPDPIMVGAGALVINENNRILLFRRPDSVETEPGCWSQPGGRLLFGEDPKDATLRKLNEEVGLHAKSLNLLTIHSSVRKQNGNSLQWISICYLCRDFDRTVTIPDGWKEKEDIRWDWFDLIDLPKPLSSFTKASIEALVEYAKKL